MRMKTFTGLLVKTRLITLWNTASLNIRPAVGLIREGLSLRLRNPITRWSICIPLSSQRWKQLHIRSLSFTVAGARWRTSSKKENLGSISLLWAVVPRWSMQTACKYMLLPITCSIGFDDWYYPQAWESSGSIPFVWSCWRSPRKRFIQQDISYSSCAAAALIRKSSSKLWQI